MRTKEERMIDAIGDTNDNNVLIAVGHEYADANLKTELHKVELKDAPKLPEKDIRHYRIRTAVIGGVAAAVAVTGGVVLWNSLRRNAAEIDPTVSSNTEPIVTIYVPDIAATDPLAQKTDLSMPEPFDGYDTDDTDRFDDFNSQWVRRFRELNSFIYEAAGSERAASAIADFEAKQKRADPNRLLTPYKLDDNFNLYWFMKQVGLSGEEAAAALRKSNEYLQAQKDEGSDPPEQITDMMFSFEELAAIETDDVRKIPLPFMSEYSIVVDDNVFSARWMYYHTAEDYETAGITALHTEVMLPTYEKLGFTDEAWAAFKSKLEGYIASHKTEGDEKKYIIPTGSNDVTSDAAIGVIENAFFGRWSKSDGSSVTYTYAESPFDFEGHYHPYGIGETDDIYYMTCMLSGEMVCRFIEKSDPDVMYGSNIYFPDGYENSYVADASPDPTYANSMTEVYERDRDFTYSTEIQQGKISLLGQYKLMNMYGEDFGRFLNETLSSEFEDDFGHTYTAGGDMLTPPSERYFIDYFATGGVVLAVRYFEMTEYEKYLEDPEGELTEYWFLVNITDESGAWSCSYKPLSQYRTTQLGAIVSEVTLNGLTISGYRERADIDLGFDSGTLRVYNTVNETVLLGEAGLSTGLAGLDGYVCGSDIRIRNEYTDDGKILVSVWMPIPSESGGWLVSFYWYDGEKLRKLKYGNGGEFELEAVVYNANVGIVDGVIYFTTSDDNVIGFTVESDGCTVKEVSRRAPGQAE